MDRLKNLKKQEDGKRTRKGSEGASMQTIKLQDAEIMRQKQMAAELKKAQASTSPAPAKK